MSVNTHVLTGGFAQPVFDAQSVFRLLMESMARPGTVRQVETLANPPAPLGAAAGAVALTLCDPDTPVWLAPSLQRPDVVEWMAFHAGVAQTREKAECRFAFLGSGDALPSFGLFSQGTQEYPDRSATLVIEVASVDAGDGYTLSGPGIAKTTDIAVTGLPDAFRHFWSDNRSLFPRGVDVVLTAGDRLVCLPRTTKIA